MLATRISFSVFLLSIVGCASIAIEAPTVRPFADGREWIVMEPLYYRIRDTDLVITVPAGFVTDFASVPRRLWSFYGPIETYGRAAIVHDFLYWDQGCTRDQADRLFMLAMMESGVWRCERNPIYAAVRIGGGNAWETNAAERREGMPRIIPEGFRRIPAEATWPLYRQYLFENGVRAEPFPEIPVLAAYCTAADGRIEEPESQVAAPHEQK
jgi:hypothetical protein